MRRVRFPRPIGGAPLGLRDRVKERRGHEDRFGLERALADNLDELPLPVLLELEHPPGLAVFGAAGAPPPPFCVEGTAMAAPRAPVPTKVPPRPLLLRSGPPPRGPPPTTGRARPRLC